MKPKVYIETSIVSYLAAWRSRDLVTAANQEATREWWDEHSKDFELYISETVIQEAAGGDEHAATRRLGILEQIIDQACRKRGYEAPVICTPLELME